MAKGHTPGERYHIYRRAWMLGARLGPIPSPEAEWGKTKFGDLRDDEDFVRGYSDGRRMFGEVMHEASQHYGYVPSILRTQEA